MARELIFKAGGKEYTSEPYAIDRKKLYGWSEIVVLDDKGNECKTAYTDQSGTFLIPTGGTAQAILDRSGRWVNNTDINVIDENGHDAELVVSSYKKVMELKDTVTVDFFLDYSIANVYELFDMDASVLKLAGDKIYTFDFTYNDSYETRPAFLIESEGKVFMLVGIKNTFEMIGFEESSSIDEDEDFEEDIDFEDMF